MDFRDWDEFKDYLYEEVVKGMKLRGVIPKSASVERISKAIDRKVGKSIDEYGKLLELPKGMLVIKCKKLIDENKDLKVKIKQMKILLNDVYKDIQLSRAVDSVRLLDRIIKNINESPMLQRQVLESFDNDYSKMKQDFEELKEEVKRLREKVLKRGNND